MRNACSWRLTAAPQTPSVSGELTSFSRVPVGCRRSLLRSLWVGSVQSVRNVIRAFNRHGVAGLVRHSNRPESVEPILNAVNCERLQHILHQSPRTYGQAPGVWTLALAAQVCHEHGVTERCLSEESIRRALQRLQTN